MPQPTAYTPTADFSLDEANGAGGRSTVNTAALDAELAGISTTLAGVRTNLALNQRDDGEIRDERVKLHTLAPEVKAMLLASGAAIRGAWVTAAAYAIKDVVTQGGNTYIAATAHTAGTFATDLAAGRWVLLTLGGTTAAAVPFVPTATLAATTVQAAIEEADTEGRALSAVALAAATTLQSDLASSATGSGDAMIAVKKTAIASVASTLHEVNERTISVFDFMTPAQIEDVKAGTRLYDTAAAINAAVAAAAAVFTTTDPMFTHKQGGRCVYLPAGVYRVDSTVTIPGVGFHGAGLFSTVITSSYNGRVLQGQPAAGAYNMSADWSGFTLVGDRTKTSQVGISLLRPADGQFNNIVVHSCGGDSWVIREGLSCLFNNVHAFYGKGAGFRLMDGINSWTDTTPTNYPTNGCVFNNAHGTMCDGPGLKFDGTGTATLGFVNGCEFFGGTFEFNYYSSAAGTGYNVEDYSAAYLPNQLTGVWLESTTVKAHVYKAGIDVTNTLLLTACKHTSQSSALYPERFAIVTVGRIVADRCAGIGNSYRSVSGSTAPIRITKATARAEVFNPMGSTVTGGLWVEDETNSTSGLYNNVRQTEFNAFYGPISSRTDSTAVGFEQYRTGDAFPFFRLSGDRSIRVGNGSSAPVAVLANNVIGVSADRGDASVTLVAGIDETTQRFATALTAARTVTLSSTGTIKGHKFRIVRTGLGAFTLDVGGLKTLPSATAAWAEVEHDGTAWRLTGYGTL